MYLFIYAVYGPGKQPIAELPPAASPQLVDLSAGAAIREDPRSAAGACCCQCCCCCFDDHCPCLCTIGHISYWYDRIIITVYGFSRHGIRVTLYALVRVAQGTAWLLFCTL